VEGHISPKSMETLSRGVWRTDGGVHREGKGGRSHVKLVKRSRDMTVLDITIREGKNSQLRRMLARLGHKVRDLTRVKMGPLSLEGLSVGQFRNLTGREVAQLRGASMSGRATDGE
jgi:23S rRNA pseudouridine2605 synthase